MTPDDDYRRAGLGLLIVSVGLVALVIALTALGFAL